MKQIRIYTTLLFLMVLSSVATAQFVSPVDFMRNNPRSSYANPAFYTQDYGYFDVFLGGINVGAQNLGLKYDKFFRFNENGQPVVLDINHGIASLNKTNYLNTYFNYDVFNCGRRTKHGYFTYTHRFREMETFSYNRDLAQLLLNGNSAFLGESNPADISVGFSARVFQEFDFGYQMSLTEHLNIGMRTKFLMGVADVKTNNMNIKLYTDPETYALKLVTDVDVTASIPYQLTMDNGKPKIVDKRFNPASLFQNYGFGVDLGAEYIIDEHWGVAAAFNDLGFIKWTKYPIAVTGEVIDNGEFYQDGAFVFTGLTPDQVNAMMEGSDFMEGIMDTLMGYFNFTPQNLIEYQTGLNANMMVRGYYDLTPQHRFSAQFTGYNMGLGMKPAMTLAYTGSFKDKYDVVATYTMLPGGCDNLGIGLSANFGGMLMYMATNNVFAFFNPANRGLMSFQFGLSFTSGTLVKRSSTVIVRNYDLEEEAE